MPKQSLGGGLTEDECRVVKALLARGWRNQDIQALVNIGRSATINGARISAVKKNDKIVPASAEEVEWFLILKRRFDLKTGLDFQKDERLIRAREAMLVAVQIFNSPTLRFKSGTFAMLANVAWTYLLHEVYLRRGIEIVGEDGRSLLLSQMLKRHDCPLSAGAKRNLNALKEIRDEVEHNLLGAGDANWLPIFQACCLNFDKTITELFGAQLSLQDELSFSLQFAKLAMEHVTVLQQYGVPPGILALDARLREGLTDDELSDLEYQFRVVYTLDTQPKAKRIFSLFSQDQKRVRK